MDDEDTNLRIAEEQDGHCLDAHIICLLGVESCHMVPHGLRNDVGADECNTCYSLMLT